MAKIMLTLVIIISGISFIGAIIRRSYRANFQVALTENQFEAAEIIINRPLTRLVMPPFEREDLRLQLFMQQKDLSRIKSQFEELLRISVGKKQKAALAQRAFMFFVVNEEVPEAKRFLKILKNCLPSAAYHRYQIMASVYLEHQAKYIPELEQLLTTAKGPGQIYCHYLLALQYGYLGNAKKKQTHLEQAQQLAQEHGLKLDFNY